MYFKGVGTKAWQLRGLLRTMQQINDRDIVGKDIFAPEKRKLSVRHMSRKKKLYKSDTHAQSCGEEVMNSFSDSFCSPSSCSPYRGKARVGTVRPS